MLRNYGLALFLCLLVAAALLPTSLWLLPPLAGVCFVCFGRDGRKPAVVLLVMMGVLVVSFGIRQAGHQRLSERLGDPVRVSGIVRHVAVEDRYIALDLVAATLRSYDGKRLTMPRTLRVTLSGVDGYGELEVGARFAGTGQLRHRRVYRNPGTDRTAFYRARNQLMTVSIGSPVHCAAAPTWISGLIQRLRPFHTGLSETNTLVLRGMVAGDRDALPESLRERVRELGIYHLFVVSGFHFGIFFAATYLLLMLVPIRPRYRKGAGLVVLACLLPMTGFSAPSVRAFLMIACYLVFSLRDIRIPPGDAVGLAGIVLLLFNPWQAHDPGFLLSFLVSGGIVASLREEDRWWRVLLRVPFVAFLVSLPIMVGWFGRLPLTGPLVNLLMTPVVTAIFYLFMLVQLHLPVTGILEWLVTGMLWLIDRLPVLQVQLISLPAAMVGLAGVAGFLLLPDRRKKWSVLAAGTVLTLLIAGLPGFTRNRMVIPDTGQSQAVLVQYQGTTWLFDAAGEWEGRLALVPRLQSLGVDRIDALFLSHFDADHAAGLPELLERIPVDVVYAPDAGGSGTHACRIRSALDRLDVPLRLLNRQSPVIESGNGLVAEIVHPVETPAPLGSGNARSLGVALMAGRTRITILGDLDGEALVRLAPELGKADILIAPHHGSRRAAVPRLRERVSPGLVVVCCGRNNRYHFPSSDFRALFSQVTFRTTADEGEIRIPLETGTNR